MTHILKFSELHFRSRQFDRQILFRQIRDLSDIDLHLLHAEIASSLAFWRSSNDVNKVSESQAFFLTQTFQQEVEREIFVRDAAARLQMPSFGVPILIENEEDVSRNSTRSYWSVSFLYKELIGFNNEAASLDELISKIETKLPVIRQIKIKPCFPTISVDATLIHWNALKTTSPEQLDADDIYLILSFV